MKNLDIFPTTAFTIGPVPVTSTVVTTWLVMAFIIVTCYLATRRLSVKPSLVQEIIEAIFEVIIKTVRDVLPIEAWLVAPVLGTLWILIGFSNLTGLLPGLRSPTSDINTTFAVGPAR